MPETEPCETLPTRPARAPRMDRVGSGHVHQMPLLRRIGLYLWIGLVDSKPPRVPGSQPRGKRAGGL